jgi:hypothetical protein
VTFKNNIRKLFHVGEKFWIQSLSIKSVLEFGRTSFVKIGKKCAEIWKEKALHKRKKKS